MGRLSQGVAMHACNVSIEEVEGRGLVALWVQGQPGLQSLRLALARVRPCLQNKWGWEDKRAGEERRREGKEKEREGKELVLIQEM